MENDEANKAASKPPRQRRWTLPAWLNHFKGDDLKILFRCWVAAWVAALLIFIQPALRSLGIATFFAALVLYIVPPAGILFVYLLASLTLLIGMCLAWAWGLLTMKAALAARPASETLARLQALQQQAVAQAKESGLPVASVQSELVFNGFMLDARVTVVYYVMICLFIYVLARLRCSNGKLVLLQIFGTIIIDLFLVLGPSLPSFNALLAQVLVKPGAIGIGLGLVCCLLFFPQSASYAVLVKMEQLIRMMEAPLDSARRRFANQPAELAQLRATKGNIIGVFKAMEPLLGFLPLDFSRGRWNAEDVKDVQDYVRETMLAALSLLDFQIDGAWAAQQVEKVASRIPSGGAGNGKRSHEIGRHQLKQSADLMNALKSPEQAALHANTVEALRDANAEVLQLCSQSVELAADCIQAVNKDRWIFRPSQQRFDELTRELEEKLGTMRVARESCATNTTEVVLGSHSDLFDEHGQLKISESPTPYSLRGIILSMVIEERILNTALAIETLLQHILEHMTARTKPRIWIPTHLQYALSWAVSGRASIPVSGTTTDPADDPDAHEEQAKEVRRRLHLVRGYVPHTQRNALSRAIVNTCKWFTNSAGMYGLRMVVVTIATAIPSALPHSAGFFYREKGIWAVITAQTCVLLYMADFSFSLISRALGTVLGGLMGMVAWYIGSGNGPGNPYGMAATTAVMTLVLIWWRIFLPPSFALSSIMTGTTFILIVGFSYDEHHAAQYGLPGQGYVAFWKRLVTVLLGFLAACIVQLFPKPPSATRHVCKTLANAIRTLSDHYALLLSQWGRAGQHSLVGAAAEQLSLEVAETLLSLNQTIALLKVDMSFGPFDQRHLKDTQEQCNNMNQALGRLLFLSTSLPKELQDRLVETTGILDDRSIGNIMAVLTVIEQSLRTGAPLPERLPAPLVRTCLESSWYARHQSVEMSTTLLKAESYRRYCVAVSNYLKFLAAVDELVLVLKGALGECHVVHEWEEDA